MSLSCNRSRREQATQPPQGTKTGLLRYWPRINSPSRYSGHLHPSRPLTTQGFVYLESLRTRQHLPHLAALCMTTTTFRTVGTDNLSPGVQVFVLATHPQRCWADCFIFTSQNSNAVHIPFWTPYGSGRVVSHTEAVWSRGK
jgi:hypothetical protein